eukprot:scaffold20982_cov70-Cyclotella_meneghiniana.AAC.9
MAPNSGERWDNAIEPRRMADGWGKHRCTMVVSTDGGREVGPELLCSESICGLVKEGNQKSEAPYLPLGRANKNRIMNSVLTQSNIREKIPGLSVTSKDTGALHPRNPSHLFSRSNRYSIVLNEKPNLVWRQGFGYWGAAPPEPPASLFSVEQMGDRDSDAGALHPAEPPASLFSVVQVPMVDSNNLKSPVSAPSKLSASQAMKLSRAKRKATLITRENEKAKLSEEQLKELNKQKSVKERTRRENEKAKLSEEQLKELNKEKSAKKRITRENEKAKLSAEELNELNKEKSVKASSCVNLVKSEKDVNIQMIFGKLYVEVQGELDEVSAIGGGEEMNLEELMSIDDSEDEQYDDKEVISENDDVLAQEQGGTTVSED